MGQPIPLRWLLFTGCVLTVMAGGLFWWGTTATGRGGVFVIGFGFLAASGVLACIVLILYHACCRSWCRQRTPPLE